jgi:beta-glucosidase-like glycosyl hydrolase
VLTAVQNGTISEKRLNASVTRILKCKAKLNKTAKLK